MPPSQCRCGCLVSLLVVIGMLGPTGSQEAQQSIQPNNKCTGGLYFNTILQRCTSCKEIDPRAVASASTQQGTEQCTCARGLVQCYGGDVCTAEVPGSGNVSSLTSFEATGEFQCNLCPDGPGGQPMAPTQDRRSCLPCDSSTEGFSSKWGDCVCAQGSALVERRSDGEYLPAKSCVRCKDGILHSPASEPLPVYDCSPCDDPARKYRDAATGRCICRQGSADTDVYIAAGGSCVSTEEYNKVNDRFPEAAAIRAQFRDIIDGRENWWRAGPFGQFLGIEWRGLDTREVLSLDVAGSQDATVSSAAVQWLYARCGVECLRGNTTACQCISNLCVLMLYSDDSEVCKFVSDLYAGREPSPTGQGVVGMPWLYYEPQRPSQTLTDTSINWKYTFSKDGGGLKDATNTLVFWLASYSLEGAWLGWKRLDSQLDLCAALGGTTKKPRIPPSTWKEFGSSVRIECSISVNRLLQCGSHPIFYDLFLENVGGSLVPVPVRILNIVWNRQRPNVNYRADDAMDDVLVRRFTMCDAVTGREGGPEGAGEAYLKGYENGLGYQRVVRWAAHVAVQVRVNPDSVDGAHIYVPVLNLAYADKRADSLAEDTSVPASFTAEYSMDATDYWTAFIVILVLAVLLLLGLALFRAYLVNQRYPGNSLPMGCADPHLFAPKFALQSLAFCSTSFSVLFWFQFTMSLFWLIMFKAQDTPHLLLPSALDGGQYEPFDIISVIVLCFGTLTVALGFWKQNRVFFFLVDWEKPQEGARPPPPLPGHGATSRSPTLQQPGSFAAAAQAAADAASGTAQMVGSALLGGAGTEGATSLQVDAPDSGVSAWRSLFVCNELNERMTSTRTIPVVTWVSMAILLEGCGWANAARWYTQGHESNVRFNEEVVQDVVSEALLAAQFNPFLQFSLGALVWMFVIFLQLIIRRIASIPFGHDLNDFVDVCSIANISVFILDEPYHGYYIHGMAPSTRGELSHTELEKVLHDEDTGIGFSRGLTPDGCQTFEMFLPPDMTVLLPSGHPAHFRQTLCQVFADVQQTRNIIAQRTPPKPTAHDVAAMSKHRCNVQVLIDSIVQAVVRGAGDVLQVRGSLDWFWGRAPEGGVVAQQHPVFYKDQDGLSFPNGLGWSSSLAHGAELRFGGIGFPTGFEWHLGLLELLIFSFVWRFHGSIFLGTFLAYLFNQLVLQAYAAWAKQRLAHTAIINGMFLI